MKRLPIRRTLAACAVMVLAAAGARLRAADELPKAETILDKFVEVTGGKAAYEKTHSIVITGSMELAAMGIKGTMVITKAEPDRSLAEIDISGIGSVKQGYDGKVAWEINPMQGARIKDGDEKAEAKHEAYFHEENWRDQYKKVETVGAETVEGKDCYKLLLTPNEGNPETSYYDKKSGFLVKTSKTVSTPNGDIEASTVFSDYRKEGDLTVVHKIQQSAGGQDIAITFESYKYNADLAKDKFDLPDDIKALVKK
jgi:outer membrane lipoprotein-sorting protein